MLIFLNPPLGHDAKPIETTDEIVANNLLRRGWTKRPDAPKYNSDTQSCQWENGEWILRDKQRNSEDVFSDKISEGFLVRPENFVLALDDDSRANFTSMLTLIQEALALGFMDNDTEVSIKSARGELIVISCLRFRQIMVEYGFYYKSLWDKK